MSSKLKSRPGSSARVYDDERTDFDSSVSKIPKLPKRTYSLEGKRILCPKKRPSSRYQSSTTSMIPRPEWSKYLKRTSTPDTPNRERNSSKTEVLKPNTGKSTNQSTNDSRETEGTDQKKSPTALDTLPKAESKINEEFHNFKKNVLRIPEYWTDAGQTVTNILKNAINIVTKQYPSADVESFEVEIQNILKATEAVKQEILNKTESIISQANKLYLERKEVDGHPTENLLRITKKMEELRREVHMRNNVFGDLLKYSSEVRHLVDIEKSLKVKQEVWKDSPRSGRQKKNGDPKSPRQSDRRKSKINIDPLPIDGRKREKTVMQSCGDVQRDVTVTAFTGSKSREVATVLDDKSTQTVNSLTAELHTQEEQLNNLNNQILELHQLCKDHISKFKSFNLQIKLRGICNKAQNMTACKEIQILNDEKIQLAEKNNRLQYYNKDLESAIKQRDLDLHQKDRLISQQKKLLHVRDELIEMLKMRCNIQETEQV